MRALLFAVGFLTRIPVPPAVFGDERARAHSLAWYPLVGLLLGTLLCGLAWCLRDISPLPGAAIVLAAWVASTGALHLDGLADSADAWIGGMGDRERTLSIMKDPRCGPAGVIALVLVLLLKFAALASLPVDRWYALWLAPLLGRAALSMFFLTTPYVRLGGLGSGLLAAPRWACWLGLASSGGFCLWFGRPGGWALLGASVVFWAWRRACVRRLGGFTGDTAGAMAEMVETSVLLVVSVLPLR